MDEFAVDVSESRILVVDDLPANLEVLCQALELAGYQAMIATSGQQALKLAGPFVPDLILLDVIMPGLDGFEVCRRLKQQESTRTIPVLFLTARDDTADLVEGFRAGGADYVVKPFQKEEVLARVQTHLEKAGLMRTLREKNAALEAEIARRQALAHERDQLASQLSLALGRPATDATAGTDPDALVGWPELPLDLERALELAEEEVVRRALAQSDDNVSAAARLLGTNRPRVYRALERLKERPAG